MTAIIIAIAVVVVLAALLLLAVARRRDTGAATGGLSRETRKRDRSGVVLERARGGRRRPPLRGRAYERSVALERIGAGGAVEPVRTAPPAVYVPPDPETLGVTRRQFLNRSIVGFMVLSLSAFGAVLHRLPVAHLQRRVRFEDQRRQVDDVKARIQAADGFLYVPEGRMWVTEYPIDKVPKAEPIYSPSVLTGMRGRPGGPVADLPAPGLPGAASASPPSGSSAPATARSTTGSARSAAGPRPGAWTASPRRSTAATTSSSTPARSSRARRSAPTPPARRPRAPTASARPERTDAATCWPRRQCRRRSGSSSRRSSSSASSSTSSSTCARPGRSWATRSSSPPTASRTTTTRQLEGPRLDRYLTAALVLLGVVAVGLPLYWLAEPGRQAGQIERFEEIFAHRGELQFEANCASCHAKGGVGGVAAYVLNDKDGQLRRQRLLAGAGARQRAAALRPGGGAVRARPRSAVLAHAAVVDGRWRLHERPADQEHHRLPGVDHDHARRGAAAGHGRRDQPAGGRAGGRDRPDQPAGRLRDRGRPTARGSASSRATTRRRSKPPSRTPTPWGMP